MSVIYKSMDGYKEDRTDTKDRKKNRDSKNKKDRTDTKDHRHKKDSKDTKDSKNKKDHKAGKKGKKPAQPLYRRDNAGAVQPPEISSPGLCRAVDRFHFGTDGYGSGTDYLRRWFRGIVFPMAAQLLQKRSEDFFAAQF